ncbi:serine/threonine-protein phosphatase 2A regulatory subunit A [Nematocida homosporus]|uniref:serine/threonine-protein phosphatase 2A regulatory subunit A n=1 Tax=Nematocida homosporus TaxID=1912981 RepID=UPI00222061A7|nr:serine/threonine-protein phosphatase 2A regulatory subunit A [Nematocida homosporus]KAI5187274.1 serine/threonine-protein phosphatase 2A regulatory subunit A [Nematocida homosporus]
MSESSTVRYDEIEKEIERMQSANSKTREESLEKLFTIATEIGKLSTIQYLLPFIKTILDTNEAAKRPIIRQVEQIAKELVLDLKPVILIFKELFLTRDEEIRREAAESLVSIGLVLGEKKELMAELEQVEELVLELGQSKFIMHRLSALALIKKVVNEAQCASYFKRIRSLVKQLLVDTYPIVQKRVLSLPDVLSGYCTADDLLELSERLLDENEDSVRSCFDCPAGLLPWSTAYAEFFIRIFKKGAVDVSWEVRNRATSLIKVALGYAYETNSGVVSDLLEILDNLMTDKEELVRVSTIKAIPGVFFEVPRTKETVLSLVERASRDSSARVKQMVPMTLAGLADALDRSEIEERILPIVRRLLGDEDTETKMETIARLRLLYAKLGPSAIASALTPVISDLGSASWRTRTAVLRSIASLSRQIEHSYFEVHLKSAFFQMFTDPVWEVRREAARILAEISLAFGTAWVLGEAFPALDFLRTSSNYAQRISYVWALGEVLRTLWPRTVQQAAASLLQECARDPVAQVRLAVVHALQASVLEQRPDILQTLLNDPHPEIVRAVQESL